jgi:membrane protease YdiL (CAAX protease family)
MSLAVAVIVFGQALELLIGVLLETRSDLGGYGALAGNVDAALKLLALALTSAAIGEEILSRGFLLHQLTAILGEGAAKRWVAIIVGGVIFGAAHFMQGPIGMITTGLTGIIFGWAWFRSERNLWAMMLAHALVDSFGITMLYLGIQL